MKFRIIIFLIFFSTSVFSQKKNVLFIGNSYSYFNDMPRMTSKMASSAGDSLYVESHLVGGWSLKLHAGNNTTKNKVKKGIWDFVVLQEYSRTPSYPQYLVDSLMKPYAHFFDSLIQSENPCAQTMFYMTWGRKNGNSVDCPYFPEVCTYASMDSLTKLRYEQVANENNALLAPVGAVWNYIRKNHPQIELYTSDGSHPSLAGSYAAACTFYTSIFRKDPSLITYDTTLTSSVASIIRDATKNVVYNQLALWNIGKYDAQSEFTFITNGKTLKVKNRSENSDQFVWDFGDGNYSSEKEPNHEYKYPSNYEIKLMSSNCFSQDIAAYPVEILTSSVVESGIEKLQIYPNPTREFILIDTEKQLEKVEIYDVYGRLVFTDQEFNFNKRINVSELASGLYFIKVYGTGNHTQTVQFQKIKN